MYTQDLIDALEEAMRASDTGGQSVYVQVADGTLREVADIVDVKGDLVIVIEK